MRVNEIRRNTVGAAKTNTKVDYANKQAFSALPYISKTTSRVLAIGKALYSVVEFFGKLNFAKLFKKTEKMGT